MKPNRPEVPESIQGLLLDFDGTLADTVGAHTEARRDAFNQLGIFVTDAIQEEAHRHGSHPPEIIGWILKQVAAVEAEADVYTDTTVQSVVKLKNELYFAKATSGLRPVPGAIEYLQAASAYYGSEHVVIVTTATRGFEVAPFLRKHNLEACVGFIIAREDTPVASLKPHPYAYAQGLTRIGLPPDQIMAVEDSPRGVQAVRAASPDIWIAGITTTHGYDDLISVGANMVIHSLDELTIVTGK